MKSNIRRGFTMVELGISVSIVTLLSGATLIMFRDAQNREWEVQARALAAAEFATAGRHLRADVANARSLSVAQATLFLELAGQDQMVEYQVTERGLVRRKSDQETELAQAITAWEPVLIGDLGVQFLLTAEQTDGARWRTMTQTIRASRRVEAAQ